MFLIPAPESIFLDLFFPLQVLYMTSTVTYQVMPMFYYAKI